MAPIAQLMVLLQICLVNALPQAVYTSASLRTPEVAIQRVQTSDGSAQILPSKTPGTSFTITTWLETSGISSIAPFPTPNIPQPSTTISINIAAFTASVSAVTSSVAAQISSAFGSQVSISSRTTGPRTDTKNPLVQVAAGQASVQCTCCSSSTTGGGIVTPGPVKDPSSVPTRSSGPQTIRTTITSTSTMVISPSQTSVGASNNIFSKISSNPPLGYLGSRADHPVPRKGIVPQDAPISTNKFYANFFLSSQGQPTWTHPYVVSWCKGTGNARSWGLCISHADAEQKAFGPGTPSQYYINPGGLQSIILSAAELNSNSVISMDTLTAFSANLNFHAASGSPPGITFPLVQGMGFVTATYNGLRPFLQSSIFFGAITRVQNFNRAGIVKYRIDLLDGKQWLVYVTPAAGQDISFQSVSNTLIEATAQFTGTIQAAKNTGGAGGEAIYDAAAGAYATGAKLSGTVSGNVGSYTLAWQRAGLSTTASPLLMFALPHHAQTFQSSTYAAVTSLRLQTTTKGVAAGVVADSWTMVEVQLPLDIGFAPWSPSRRSVNTLSDTVVQMINNVGASEIAQDMNAQTNLDSMYFSGKALSKFADIVYTLHDLGRNPQLAQSGLTRLQDAFSVFVQNRQKFPLVYDSAWKGLISTGAIVTGDAGQDFGNTYYNDHHFHYGYFIHAAAIIGYLDPSWLAANRDYVNLMVRDAANPSTDDPYFPVSRSFDWYHGHSWAKGLFESGDGKDEESSSEDAFFAYAVKMWGKTIGDANMEARGNLMLSVLTRTLHTYFLMESTNFAQPKPFIDNKVTGILFENKADHATYFGSNIEYIQGIHMIPLNPSSALTRNTNFVTEEWNRFFSNGRVDQIAGGWRGILYANLAIIDPVTSYNFFAQPNFDMGWIDGGASRTWYLAYTAGLGGA